MTNIKLFNLITKPYVSNKEIKEIAECGINKANDIRKTIEKKYCQNMLLPKHKIPTEFLLKELGIKVSNVFNLAKKEKELGGIKNESSIN